MEYGIYAIYDVALKRYSQPFYHPNDEVAKRTFKIAINQPQAEHLYQIREDLELWYLGSYNDKTGYILTVVAEAPRRVLGRGEAVIHNEKKEEEQDAV